VTRKTRIVATLGPKTANPESIRQLIDAGMNVARLNFSHGNFEQHAETFAMVRKAAIDARKTVAILIDLPGPKVRIAAAATTLNLVRQQTIQIAPSASTGDVSTIQRLAVDYEWLMDDVRPGNQVSLKDGTIRLHVDQKHDGYFTCTVLDDGELQGRPGIHLPSETFRITAPTDEDLVLLRKALALEPDMFAVSFVRSARDLHTVRDAIKQGMESLGHGDAVAPPIIIAKIETRPAIENLKEIVQASDGLMVARGDLGTELPLEEVPHLQKQIIRAAILEGKPVITATQMLESMITSPRPTRAETTDVANAVLDGTDAVMLSAESATGDHPIEAVQTMARIAERAEDMFPYDIWSEALVKNVGGPDNVDHTMSAVAWIGAHEAQVAAILCVTRRGNTARFMARFRSQVPIYAVTTSVEAQRQLALSWGVEAIISDRPLVGADQVKQAVDIAVAQGFVKSGDVVAVLANITNRHATGIVGTFSLVRVD
jgi:pyruvate kinase